MHIRTRAGREAVVSGAAAVRDQLERVEHAGVELWMRLQHDVSENAYVNHYAQRGADRKSTEVAARFQAARTHYPACPGVGWIASAADNFPGPC